MKKLFLSLLAGFLLWGSIHAEEIPVVPLPNEYQRVGENFVLDDHVALVSREENLSSEKQYFKQQLLKLTGKTISESNQSRKKIVLALKKQKNELGKEGYSLKMDSREIRIEANDAAGIFYGLTSLLQIISKQKIEHSQVVVPCWNMNDTPLYSWRGYMLDESRHFFGKKVVKQILNQMAWLKLNKFHWHLTDEPGWRLEIKKYPKLTLIGGIGNYKDSLAPAAYYTQEDIAEIVTYAAKRHIEIIPELDMPGHATAANRAYPEYSGGGSEQFPNFTFNPGKEATYSYLTNILKEMAVMFPSKMIHLGGDEVSFGIKGWNDKPEIQDLMKEQHLKDLKGVESYFFDRMADSSRRIFNKILAWDEAVDGDLTNENVIIYWWRHDKPEQLRKALEGKYHVVLSPRIPLYLDFVQESDHVQGRKWKDDFSTVQGVYEFTDHTYLNDAQGKDLILGIQANLWSEEIKTVKRLQFMTYPRLDALSEAAWTQPDKRDYGQFLRRLKDQLKLYDKQNIFYFNPISPEKTPEVIDQNLRLNIK